MIGCVPVQAPVERLSLDPCRGAPPRTGPARFAGDLAETTDDSASLILARLHGAWTRGVSALEGGERELEDFLTERVIAPAVAGLHDGQPVRVKAGAPS